MLPLTDSVVVFEFSMNGALVGARLYNDNNAFPFITSVVRVNGLGLPLCVSV